MIVSLLARTVAAAVVWFALVEGDPTMVGYGIAVVPVAVAASYLPTGRPGPRRGRLVPRGLAAVGLVGWLLGRSVAGGVDVASRAVRLPRPRVDPYWTTYSLRLESPAGRTAVVFLMNLIPGTLSASRTGDTVEVHVIGHDIEVDQALRTLERRVARVLGHEWP